MSRHQRWDNSTLGHYNCSQHFQSSASVHLQNHYHYNAPWWNPNSLCYAKDAVYNEAIRWINELRAAYYRCPSDYLAEEAASHGVYHDNHSLSFPVLQKFLLPARNPESSRWGSSLGCSIHRVVIMQILHGLGQSWVEHQEIRWYGDEDHKCHYSYLHHQTV